MVAGHDDALHYYAGIEFFKLYTLEDEPMDGQQIAKHTSWDIMAGYEYDTNIGSVNVIIRPHEVIAQMTPDDAVRIAHSLLQAAAVARSNAFIAKWLSDEVKMDARAIADILIDYGFNREGANCQHRSIQTG